MTQNVPKIVYSKKAKMATPPIIYQIVLSFSDSTLELVGLELVDFLSVLDELLDDDDELIPS
jgi:hypothetical protein